MIFNENVSVTETIISAPGISKYSKLVDTLARSPINDINIKIIKKNLIKPSLQSKSKKYIKNVSTYIKKKNFFALLQSVL